MYYSKGQKLLSAIILAVLFTCAVLSEGIVWFTDTYWHPISAEFGSGRPMNANLTLRDDGSFAFVNDFGIPGGLYTESCLCTGDVTLWDDLAAALFRPSPSLTGGETFTDNMRGNMEALSEVVAEIGESSVSDTQDDPEDTPDVE